MKKVYETPTIEYDDFELDSLVCANLYGSNHNKRSTEFYAIGGGTVGASSAEGNVPIIDTGDGDDLF
ncbi:hypothetical protein [Ruminococcus bovis]|uniref:Uncharacterized protein n=1 Tax=Ruminococcus bovis TaxID=2564099 RepID=A0A4P8XWF2_9FIRM|nr:hypothetical protein [Ruminococcus bovis]QCT07466.1 hypothetical protein E5Z56_08925 [Ruminococcus bovis]